MEKQITHQFTSFCLNFPPIPRRERERDGERDDLDEDDDKIARNNEPQERRKKVLTI